MSFFCVCRWVFFNFFLRKMQIRGNPLLWTRYLWSKLQFSASQTIKVPHLSLSFTNLFIDGVIILSCSSNSITKWEIWGQSLIKISFKWSILLLMHKTVFFLFGMYVCLMCSLLPLMEQFWTLNPKPCKHLQNQKFLGACSSHLGHYKSPSCEDEVLLNT